jgi:hypothetical protein
MDTLVYSTRIAKQVIAEKAEKRRNRRKGMKYDSLTEEIQDMFSTLCTGRWQSVVNDIDISL